MGKELKYTTVDTQIDKLVSQKLIIKDVTIAKKVLAMCGYTNLIKGYRKPYIIKNENNIEYKPGVTFEQIYSLYSLDKELRNCVMACMQDLEEHIKETASGVLADSFGIEDSQYLNFKNFKNKKKRNPRFTLSYILNSLTETLDTDKNPICHYKKKYGFVPPWILFKSVYLSTIVNLIDLFNTNEITQMAKRLYRNIDLPDAKLCRLMTDTLFICLEYRNMAAHGNRIYNYSCHSELHHEEIWGKPRHERFRAFSVLLCLLEYLDYHKPYKRLYNTLEREISRHCKLYPQDLEFLQEILSVNIVTTDTVFVSPRSHIYHNNPHCSGIISPYILDANEAKNKGYSPCKRCRRS